MIRPYDTLSRAGQMRRMRALAEVACEHYTFEKIHLTPLAHFFNTTFRIDAPQGAAIADPGGPFESPGVAAHGRFVLRIHRAGGPDVQTIQSELLWLQALRRDAGLVVPEPLAARDGRLVTGATVPGVPESRQCVIFRWVEGRFLRARLGTKEIERVGVFMARLHLQAEGYRAPEGFIRPRWDHEGVCGRALGVDLALSRAHVSRPGQALIERASERVRQAMELLGEERAVFGLIHADFYERNYLFAGPDLHAIDFDGCGWGHYLFDIGVSFSTLLVRSDYLALRQAFLAGYRGVRALSAEHEALIDIFISARLIGHIHWLAAHVQQPAYGERARKRIELELAQLTQLLA